MKSADPLSPASVSGSPDPHKKALHAPDAVLELRFRAARENVQGVLAMVQKWTAAQGVGREAQGTLRLVLEELLLNICFHAYPGGAPEPAATAEAVTDTELLVAVPPTVPGTTHATRRISVRICDMGLPFNPLEHVPAQVGPSARATPPGGKGLAFVGLLTVQASYFRANGVNTLSLTLPLSAKASADSTQKQTSAVTALSLKSFLQGPRRSGTKTTHPFSSLAARQTVFLGLAAVLLTWAGMYLFSKAAHNERTEAAHILGEQIMQSLDRASSDLFSRMETGAKNLARSKGAHVHRLRAGPETGGIWLGPVKESIPEIPSSPLSGADSPPVSDVLSAASEKPPALVFVLPRATVPGRDSESARQGTEAWSEEKEKERETGVETPGARETGEEREILVGVLVSVPELARMLKELSPFPEAEPFLLNSRGEYVIFPPGRSLHGGQGDIFSDARFSGSPEMKMLGREMLEGKQGAMRLFSGQGASDSEDLWPTTWDGPVTVLYRPMHIPGWSLGLLVPSQKLEEFPVPPASCLALAALLGPLGFAVLVWRVTSRTLRPLRELSESLESITEEDLDRPLPVPVLPDETGALVRSFERARFALRATLQDLLDSAAARERLHNEHSVARALQESLLCGEFPSPPHTEVYARIDMAPEICGALYDCFVMPLPAGSPLNMQKASSSASSPPAPEQLCCVVGDVSGRGIPAALLMSRAIDLIRAALLEGLPPGKTLERVNAALLRGDVTAMSVAMLVLTMNPLTGFFSWSAAGHPPPLRAGLSHPVPRPKQPALGTIPGQGYASFSHVLPPGETLLLHTDGAVHALASSGDESRANGVRGETRDTRRLAEILARNSSAADAPALLQGVREDIFTHMAGATPRDDITLMVIRR